MDDKDEELKDVMKDFRVSEVHKRKAEKTLHAATAPGKGKGAWIQILRKSTGAAIFTNVPWHLT
jgi:hypothetical protein